MGKLFGAVFVAVDHKNLNSISQILLEPEIQSFCGDS